MVFVCWTTCFVEKVWRQAEMPGEGLKLELSVLSKYASNGGILDKGYKIRCLCILPVRVPGIRGQVMIKSFLRGLRVGNNFNSRLNISFRSRLGAISLKRTAFEEMRGMRHLVYLSLYL